MDREELKQEALNLLKSDSKDSSTKDDIVYCIEELEMLDHLTSEERNLISSLKDKLDRINLINSSIKLLETLKGTSKDALVNPYIRDDLNYYIRELENLENPTEEELDLLSSLKEQLIIDQNRPLNEADRYPFEDR